jgi:4-aminobutyrate aminotransferase
MGHSDTRSPKEIRRAWRAETVSEAESSLLARDEVACLTQANSTPALMGIASAQGVWVHDASGRRYCDLYGNNCHHVGHQHPVVVGKVREQLEKLCFVPRGLTSDLPVQLAEKLIGLYPDPASRVLFVPGGSEAVEVAIMIAKVHTRRYKTVSFWGAYHGRSAGALSLGGSADRSPAMGPLLPGSLNAPPFYWYARKPRTTHDDLVSSAARSIEALETLFETEGEIAALIAEPIRNGPYVPPAGYWADVRALCDRHGALLIFDDIPTGLGKTGRLFNCEHFDVKPDMTLLGKALGGAILPLAAVIVSSRLDTTGEFNLGYFTHEKNALSAAAGLATLSVLIDEKLPARAQFLGTTVGKRLESIRSKHEVVANVRHAGLMFAIDFDGAGMGTRGTGLARDVYYAALHNGVLPMPPKANTLSFSAPLVISERELVDALNAIESSISGLKL